MGGKDVYCLICFLFGLFLCSGSSVKQIKSRQQDSEQLLRRRDFSHIVSKLSTSIKEVTNPVTTVPLVNLPVPNSATPLASTSSYPAPLATTMAPAATTTSSSPTESWCVATQSASVSALQAALDYACSRGGADCSAIQPIGRCYYPNTLWDHASFAFNNFYQKNPIPSSCNFGGAAVITSTNPSSDKCRYPSTSTSSSILNTTIDSGSTVFGAEPQPSTSSGSATEISRSLTYLLILTFLMAWRRE